MSDHASLYNQMVSRLPQEARDPKKGVSKKILEEAIEKYSKETVEDAKHVSCSRKARELVKALRTTAYKRMQQFSGKWYVTSSKE